MEGAAEERLKAQLAATDQQPAAADEQLKIQEAEVARQAAEMQRLKDLLLEKEALLTEQKTGNARELSLAQTQAKRDVGNFSRQLGLQERHSANLHPAAASTRPDARCRDRQTKVGTIIGASVAREWRQRHRECRYSLNGC
jgi:hypothetical protein